MSLNLQLLSAIDLWETAGEAAELWHGNASYAHLSGDILEGMECTLDSVAAIFSEKRADALKHLRRNQQELRGKKHDALAFYRAFCAQRDMFYETCALDLVDMLATPPPPHPLSDIDAEAAARLYALIDRLPESTNIEVKSALMWLVSMCCASSMPQESYEWTLKAFALNPEIRANFKLEKPLYAPGESRYTEHCPACEGKGVPYYVAHQYLAINYEPFFAPVKLWMRCEDCGTLFAYNFPVLRQEDFVGCDSSAVEENIQPRFSLSVFAEVIRDIRKYTHGLDFMEVGIGNGEQLAVAVEMGYTVEGVEISMKEADKVARQLKLPVHCCDFLDYSSEKLYDVIVMGDVIEHMFTPIEALQKAWSFLKPGGVLWLSTPNYKSAFSRFYNFTDPMWREPWHACYFSFDSIMPHLQRIGYQLLEYNVSRHYNGSMELILTKPALA